MPNALLQKIAQGFAQSAAARTLAYTSNASAGSLLSVFVPTFNPGITVTVSDNVNGAWTQIGGYVANGSDRGSWWYFPNAAAGATTLTVTPSGSAFVSILAHEHSVTSPTGVSIDSTVTATGNSVNPATGSCPVSGSGELVLAGFVTGAIQGATSVASPFTLENVVTISSFEDGGTADDVNASSAVTATFTMTGSGTWAAMAVSFITSGVTAPPWYPPTTQQFLDDPITQYAAI